MTFSLRPYQAAKVSEARALMGQGKKSICLVSPTGSGKCLGKGTPVLMYDGRIKAVEDIRPGDRLMGPDSTPRNVLSVCSGVEMLYRVQPKKGDSYVVNASHILSLKRTREGSHSWQNNRAGDIVNIPVTEYLKKNRYFKHIHKGWRTGVEFESRELLLIDPYFLGMWLGDGAKRYTAITTGDQEIIDWIIEYAIQIKLQHRIEYNSENSINIHINTGIRGGSAGKNPLVYALDRYGLRQRKHIPHAYKTASRADRLKVLAGFIDADGSLQRGGYDVVGVDEGLIDDIIFLARSLGFSAYKSPCKKTCVNNGKEGNYFRCNINGNTNEIPCLIHRKKAGERRQKKSVLVTGISVEQIGVGEYYGFEIDGDRLFMLGDFTVTHNTIIAAHIIHSALAKKRRVLFLAHRRELIDQCADKLRALGLLDYNVILPRHPQANNPTSQMHIASIQTLIRRELPPADLIIIDEAHHAAARQYQSLLSNYPNSYVLGLTATPERLDGKGLGDIFNVLLEVATVPQLIDTGFLVKPTCYAPSKEITDKLNGELSRIRISKGDYDEKSLGELMDNNYLVGDILEHHNRLALSRKTIIFASSISHSQHIIEKFRLSGLQAAHIDGTMRTSDRERILNDWKTNGLDIVSNCQILTEGFDYPELSCCVLARPTKSLSLYLQMPGRVMRIANGKNDAIILDHAGNIAEHGVPHAERIWTLEGSAKKRKVEKPHACFLPGCGMMFVEQEAGAIWWIAEDQSAVIENYRFMARKFERMESTGSKKKLIVCPSCHHASCKFCGQFIHVTSHDELICDHCHATYCKERQLIENNEKSVLPESVDGTLSIIEENGIVSEKITVKNEYNRLLNVAREKGYKRGWVWHRLKEKFGDHKLMRYFPWYRAEWTAEKP